jgi:hypothetical protein
MTRWARFFWDIGISLLSNLVRGRIGLATKAHQPTGVSLPVKRWRWRGMATSSSRRRPDSGAADQRAPARRVEQPAADERF